MYSSKVTCRNGPTVDNFSSSFFYFFFVLLFIVWSTIDHKVFKMKIICINIVFGETGWNGFHLDFAAQAQNKKIKLLAIFTIRMSIYKPIFESKLNTKTELNEFKYFIYNWHNLTMIECDWIRCNERFERVLSRSGSRFGNHLQNNERPLMI